MVKILDKITLDLERDEVHGWEKSRCVYRTINYVNRILRGEKAPAVEVVKAGDVYQLVYGVPENLPRPDFNYGGHRRSIAACISGAPLDAFLLEDHRADSKDVEFFPIRDMSLFCYNNLDVSRFLGNFPEEVRSRFMERCEVNGSLMA